jgi:hypothetical protein
MEILEKLLEEDHSLNDKCFTPETHESIIKIWKNEYFKKVFKEYKDSIHVSDGSEYFINKIVKLKTSEYSGYVPDLKDILFTRRKTIGITEYQTKYDKTNIEIYDVGGQRNERKVFYLYKLEMAKYITYMHRHIVSMCIE